ncbi:MAG: hypothetical protein HKL90_02315 [Elusimicrobia bacterium]|nr:hypothetical protein [Elusimicrobiota bacterium]
MKKLILLAALQIAAPSARAQFDTADHLQISMKPAISFNLSSGTFTYLFQVASASSSAQVLEYLTLVEADADTDSGGTISQILKPTNVTSWEGDYADNFGGIKTNSVSWYSAWPTSSTDDLMHPSPEALQPGKSLTNLGLISTFLPGPTTFYAQGWVIPATQEQIDAKLGASPATEPSGRQLQAIYPAALPINKNSFHGLTIGPMQSPVGLTPAALVDRLAALKHQALTLGWISGPGAEGVVQSLDAKLTAAKAALARGDAKAAEGQLTAFINELNAQHGKLIDDNAFFMLQANAQFILAKLGP